MVVSTSTTLTCHTAKIMEVFTLSRVLPGITERLDPKQFAMAGIATQHANVYLLHLTLEALHRGNCWARKFFADFKKGFDLVYHRILLAKIKLLEVHPCSLRWRASFLEGRSQVVIFPTTLLVKRGHSPGNAFRPAAICSYGQ